jgi:hypothetical protein
MHSLPIGDAFQEVIRMIIDFYKARNSRRLTDGGNCGATASASGSTATCVPLTIEIDDDDDGGEGKGPKNHDQGNDQGNNDDKLEQVQRRTETTTGCNQCSGSDDDDLNDVASHNDDGGGDDDDTGGLRRRLTYVEGGEKQGTILTYTVSANMEEDEDPLAVMAEIEDQIALFFADEENARATWVNKARELGSDMPEDTQVIFSSPEVEDDSVHISRPGDFLDHHYNSNSKVRYGTWIGAGLAGIGLMVSAKYGMKAYQLKHGADLIEQEKAADWANVEETAGELTMNPLAGGVRHRSNSGGEVY